VVVAVVVALVVGGLRGGASDTDDAPGHEMTPGAPVELVDLAPAAAEHYRHAEEHRSEYAAIPCFCGCEEFLAHRHLLDCFVRADGAGYDAHAAGCGVCLGESATAHDLLAGGADPDDVVDAVIEQFGSVPTTLPPPPE
jgi:hypothetical protein